MTSITIYSFSALLGNSIYSNLSIKRDDVGLQISSYFYAKSEFSQSFMPVLYAKYPPMGISEYDNNDNKTNQ